MAKKIPVTMRAVMQRINRRIHDDDRMLKKVRGARAIQEFGDYYVLDFRRNTCVDTHVDVEEMARELGALAEYEELVDDE